jgi:hypothetical protein
MELSWDDIALPTFLEFEAQVRYGGDEGWRTIGVTREWPAADAVALTAPPDARGRMPVSCRVVVVDRPSGGCYS